jgi:hypothetical protein
MIEMDLNTLVRSAMQTHQGGGDLVRIEASASFHATVHRHRPDPDPGSGKVLR